MISQALVLSTCRIVEIYKLSPLVVKLTFSVMKSKIREIKRKTVHSSDQVAFNIPEPRAARFPMIPDTLLLCSADF